MDRQKLTSMNIYLKYAKMWGFPAAMNPNYMRGCGLGLP